jgi:hypothetical protein
MQIEKREITSLIINLWTAGLPGGDFQEAHGQVWRYPD